MATCDRDELPLVFIPTSVKVSPSTVTSARIHGFSAACSMRYSHSPSAVVISISRICPSKSFSAYSKGSGSGSSTGSGADSGSADCTGSSTGTLSREDATSCGSDTAPSDTETDSAASPPQAQIPAVSTSAKSSARLCFIISPSFFFADAGIISGNYVNSNGIS